jgi:hypothetical protein
MLALDGRSAAVASTGLDRVFRIRGDAIERVSPRLSLLDQAGWAGRTDVPDHTARLLGGMPAGFLGAGDKESATAPMTSMPDQAQAVGEYLSRLTAWSAPRDAAAARHIRWRVVSRASIAMMRVKPSRSAP